MSASGSSVPTAHFDALYARADDPWGFETSDYEREKYAETIAALPPGRFARAFELGCSIGVLTGLLAERCDTILGGDCSEAAIERARRRNAGAPRIHFERMRAPGELPSGSFDLIVLSEVLYFLSRDDLLATAAYCEGTLAPNGLVILVNYLGATDAAFSGDAAAEAFLEAAKPWATLDKALRRPSFRLDVLARRHGSATRG
jgi:predicted TPR repeat methyltransferase